MTMSELYTIQYSKLDIPIGCNVDIYSCVTMMCYFKTMYILTCMYRPLVLERFYPRTESLLRRSFQIRGNKRSTQHNEASANNQTDNTHDQECQLLMMILISMK